MHNVSASQMNTYLLCKRRWFNDNVLKLKEPTTEDQQLGTDAHFYKEVHQKTGILPPDHVLPGKMALAALEHTADTPPGTPGVFAEHEIALPTYENGPPWFGFADLLQIQPIIRVTDYKTTKDVRYSKTPFELSVDPQMISYAIEALRLNGWEVPRGSDGGESIYFRHIYMHSKKEGVSWPVNTSVKKDHVLQQWQVNLDRVRDMVALEKIGLEHGAQAIDPTPAACSKYGKKGCPHRERCGLTPGQNLGGKIVMTIEEMARRGMMATGAVGAVGAVGINPPDAAPNNPVPPGHGQQAAPASVAPQQFQPPPGMAWNGSMGQWVPAAPPAPPQPVWNPGTQQWVFPQPQYNGPPQVLGGSAAEIAQQSGQPPAPAPHYVNQPQGTQTIQTPIAGGAGGVVLAPVNGAAAPPPAAPAAAPRRKRRTAAQIAGDAAATTGVISDLEIYVDVLPAKGVDDEELLRLEEWMAPALVAAAKAAGVPDWRCAEYRIGQGQLFVALSQLPKPTGIMLVRSQMAGADIALEFLTPFATRIWRGQAGGR